MLSYMPLDPDRNDIRMITLHGEGPSGLIECSLDHVSLNDFSPQYLTFRRIEGESLLTTEVSTLWDCATNVHLPIDKLKRGFFASPLVDNALDHFSNDPIYRDPSFRRARRYVWGDFTALSYEWGDPAMTAEVVVNGTRIQVTQNLEAALRGIGTWLHAEHKDDRMHLWIDALCINQQDVAERNVQVRRMKDIYANAFCVLAWAGSAIHAGQEQTCQLLSRVGSMMLELPEDFQNDRLLSTRPEDDVVWRGLVELASRSYWQRLWIIQEVLLANSGARLCFGDRFCLMGNYLLTIPLMLGHYQHLQRLFASGSELDSNSDLTQTFDRWDRFLRLNQFRYDNMVRPPLLALLDTGRYAMEMDKRDKVYGLLGLVDPRVSDAVVPDYHKPLLDVYLDFATSIVRLTGRLDIILQGAEDQKQSEKLPSWAPDWSLGPSNRQDAFSSGSYKEVFYENCRADGGTEHVFRDSGHRGRLLCRGFQFDIIDGLGCSRLAHGPHHDHDGAPATASAGCNTPYESSQGLREAFWEMLTLGSPFISESALSLMKDLPMFNGKGEDIRYFDVIDRFQQCIRTLTIGEQPLLSIFPSWSREFETLPDDADIQMNLKFLIATMLLRRFVITEGGYMGLSPLVARKGEGIFILRGCKMPVLLRPRGDGSYRVIGECYVQGIMKGELFEPSDGRTLKEIDIVLS